MIRAIRRAAVLAVLAVLAGCTAHTEAIARELSATRDHAEQAKAILNPRVTAGEDVPVPEASAAVGHLDSIIGSTVAMSGHLTHTKDEEGFLDRLGGLLKWIAIAVAVAAGVWFGWSSGLFALMAGWLQFITPRKRALAAMAVDVLDPNEPEQPRELIAAMRGADPVLSKAIRAEKKKRAAP